MLLRKCPCTPDTQTYNVILHSIIHYIQHICVKTKQHFFLEYAANTYIYIYTIYCDFQSPNDKQNLMPFSFKPNRGDHTNSKRGSGTLTNPKDHRSPKMVAATPLFLPVAQSAPSTPYKDDPEQHGHHEDLCHTTGTEIMKICVTSWLNPSGHHND